MPWCPYTDEEISETLTSPEHIIPLSLGGSDDFCIPVNADFNSKVGSKIDGVIANDFLTLIRRREFDTRGHSNKPVAPILRKSFLGEEKRPIQVHLRGKEVPLVWDAIDRRYLTEKEIANKSFTSEFHFGIHDNLRFMAKTALSSGYFTLGQYFRENVKHQELRNLMNFNDGVTKEDLKDCQIIAHDAVLCPLTENSHNEEKMFRSFCNNVQGSCICIIPHEKSLMFVFGLLGQYIGMLNVPALTQNYPHSDQNDLGHVIILKDRKMERISFRSFVTQISSENDLL